MGKFESAVSNDWVMIFEAIRRLIEGTCCLKDDEKVCAWDLFHKLFEAFHEHEDFEERLLFPLLSARDRSEHEAEHRRLNLLLSRCRWEFESGEGDRFRSHLKEFAIELRAHHSHDHVAELLASGGCVPEKIAADLDAGRILLRANASFLG